MIATEQEILIPAPLPHQTPIVDSAARFKVVRAGRRGGKTVLAEGCAIVGHGPADPVSGDPMFRGIAHGLDVVWVARDYTQAGIMWHEFIRPRFKGVQGVRVNEADRTVGIIGGGTLFVISAENIASARGMGKRLAGAIVEEAAWLDLQSALRDVLLPALMDNQGWLMLISTTNAGPDGNQQKETPSYFNRICEEIRAGQRSNEWAEFHFTAQDNPTIDPTSFDTLVAEYPADSPQLKQEVYAELLRAGVGLALPSLNADDHIVRRRAPARNRRQWGAFDWGFNHPWVFGWYEIDEDGNVCKVDTISGREDLPDAIATKIIASGAPISDKCFVVHAGHDIWTAKGRAVGYTGPTIAEALSAHGIKLVRAGIDRVAGLDNLRRYIEVNPVSGAARFTMMDTDGNRASLAQMQGIQLDPKNMEDALKVDADSAGRGGDDFYDETRYGLMARPIVAKVRALPVGENPDISLGYDYEHHRPRVAETADQVVAKLIERSRPNITANRYQIPRR